MNGKDIKKCMNRVALPESSKERIIRELEQLAPEIPEQMYQEEYVFDAQPAKAPILHYTMTAISACAVLAVAACGVYALGKGAFSPEMKANEQKAAVYENSSIAPEELSAFLDEYNQEHGTQLRFPTEEECAEAGTTKAECFDFLSGFPDKAAFMQYVEALSKKGETVISSFHRTNLYENVENYDEVTGYFYFSYNRSGQTYGISGVDGLRYNDMPDLIAVIISEAQEAYTGYAEDWMIGYITKEDFLGDEPASPEEAVKMMEEREKANQNGIYSPKVVNAYAADGKTVVGTFLTDSGGPMK